MSEKLIQINGAQLCAESFGEPGRPAVLLMMGAMASMLWWDEEFCRRLAERGHYVIRYDNRDVGRSTASEPGNPRYTLDDMADDAVAVLDAYQIDRAHLAGMSLGGMIAQIVALRQPRRVLTLTLIATSVFGPDNPELPAIDPKILAYHAGGAAINWSDRPSAVAYMAEGWRLLAGSKHPFDERKAFQLAAAEAARANHLPSMFNHALLQGGEAYSGRIHEINLPTLVIHGTEDPVLPYPHGIALANEIPGATLLSLAGVGHEIPQPEWETIITAMVRHIATRK